MAQLTPSMYAASKLNPIPAHRTQEKPSMSMRPTTLGGCKPPVSLRMIVPRTKVAIGIHRRVRSPC